MLSLRTHLNSLFSGIIILLFGPLSSKKLILKSQRPWIFVEVIVEELWPKEKAKKFKLVEEMELAKIIKMRL